MTKYRPGTLVRSRSFLTVDELIVIIKEERHCGWDGMLYSAYNLTHNLFMERTEKFLDEYYEIMVE